MVWRVADVVASGRVTDLADAAVLGRHAVALSGAEGSPLPVVGGASAYTSIEAALAASDPDATRAAWLAWGRDLHAASDGRSGARVVRALKETYLPLAEWEREISAG